MNLLPLSDQQGHTLDFVLNQDLEPIRVWRNAQIPILRQQHEIQPKEQIDYWTTRAYPEMSQKKPSLFLVSYRQASSLNSRLELVGYGGFVYINHEDKSAELSSLLSLDFKEPSAGFFKLSKYYFNLLFLLAKKLGIRNLTTECFDSRPEFISFLEKLGFKRKSYTTNTKELHLQSGKKLLLGSWHHEKQID